MGQFSKLNPKFQPAFDGLKEATELLLKLKDKVPVIDAYLFGSSAENKNSENSDLDILVVVSSEPDVQQAYGIVNQPFFSQRAVDWIIKTEADFIMQKEIGGVCRIAYLTGIKIS